MTASSHVTIRLAAVQAQSLPGQIEANLDHAAGLVERAACIFRRGRAAHLIDYPGRGRDLRRQSVRRHFSDHARAAGRPDTDAACVAGPARAAGLVSQADVCAAAADDRASGPVRPGAGRAGRVREPGRSIAAIPQTGPTTWQPWP